MSISTKSATVNCEAVVLAASTLFSDQTHTAGLEIAFDPSSQSDFNGGLTVLRTDSSANFSAQISVARDIVPTQGSIDAVVVSGSLVFTEASGVSYLSASGTTVTVSGSIPSGSTVNNVGIDFAEGDRSTYGGLVVSSGGTYSATHTYSYAGIYHITSRVHSGNGSVDMDSFRLNLATGLSGVDLGALTITATPEAGSIDDNTPLSVAFSASGASGISLSGDDDKNLIWRFGNLASSSKVSPSSAYSEPGLFIPMASYYYEGPTANVYISDITSTGANQ